MASFWDNLTGKSVTDAYDAQKTNVSNANKNYTDTANQYTGNAGFTNSLQQAQKGANATAQNAAQQAQTSARNSGMSKAQQAAMGANTTANTYANNFTNQQSEAANQGNNAVNAAQTNVGNTTNLANMGVNAAQTSSAAAGTLTNSIADIGKILISDERTKDAVDITDEDPLKANIKKDESASKEKAETTGDTIGSLAGTLIGNAIQPGVGGAVGEAIGGKIGKGAGTIVSSDESCKDYEDVNKALVEEHKPHNKTISDYIADLGAYLYKYKDEAQKEMPGLTNSGVNIGPMQQDLQKNPQTPSTVKELPNGTLAVDTSRLSLTNTAALSDVQRRIERIERRLNDLEQHNSLQSD